MRSTAKASWLGLSLGFGCKQSRIKVNTTLATYAGNISRYLSGQKLIRFGYFSYFRNVCSEFEAFADFLKGSMCSFLRVWSSSTPKLQVSKLLKMLLIFLPEVTSTVALLMNNSGAVQGNVNPLFYQSQGRQLLSPKSVSLAISPLPISTFWGFKSTWTTSQSLITLIPCTIIGIKSILVLNEQVQALACRKIPIEPSPQQSITMDLQSTGFWAGSTAQQAFAMQTDVLASNLPKMCFQCLALSAAFSPIIVFRTSSLVMHLKSWASQGLMHLSLFFGLGKKNLTRDLYISEFPLLRNFSHPMPLLPPVFQNSILEQMDSFYLPMLEAIGWKGCCNSIGAYKLGSFWRLPTLPSALQVVQEFQTVFSRGTLDNPSGYTEMARFQGSLKQLIFSRCISGSVSSLSSLELGQVPSGRVQDLAYQRETSQLTKVLNQLTKFWGWVRWSIPLSLRSQNVSLPNSPPTYRMPQMQLLNIPMISLKLLPRCLHTFVESIISIYQFIPYAMHTWIVLLYECVCSVPTLKLGQMLFRCSISDRVFSMCLKTKGSPFFNSQALVTIMWGRLVIR